MNKQFEELADALDRQEAAAVAAAQNDPDLARIVAPPPEKESTPAVPEPGRQAPDPSP